MVCDRAVDYNIEERVCSHVLRRRRRLEYLVRDDVLRPYAAALGIGTLIFGAVPVLAPRQFARLFGFPAPDPAIVSMMRSLGVRDVVMGMGLWSAATHGGKYAPWLLARSLVDAGDIVSVGLAVAAGVRNPRFVALGALALGATVVEVAMYTAIRGSAQSAAVSRSPEAAMFRA